MNLAEECRACRDVLKATETFAVGQAVLEEAADKIEGLEADLDSAVEVAYDRGATEWTRLNYPTQYKRLQQREPS